MQAPTNLEFGKIILESEVKSAIKLLKLSICFLDGKSL